MTAAVVARGAFMADVERRLLKRSQPRAPRKTATIPDSSHERAVAEVREAMVGGDWSLMRPRHFVALYDVLHREVYGVRPAELVSRPRALAAAMAKRLLAREFGGDAPEGRASLASYMRWAWQRERGRLAWLASQGKDPGRRIGWALCFGGSLVTDWRLAMSQQQARR